MKTITKDKRFLFYRRRLRFRIFRRDRFTCQYCGRGILQGAILTLDHLVPKSLGAELLSENLITACLDCNQGKWDDVLSHWELQDLKRELDYLGEKSKIILV